MIAKAIYELTGFDFRPGFVVVTNLHGTGSHNVYPNKKPAADLSGRAQITNLPDLG
jgi:hypothetical protein